MLVGEVSTAKREQLFLELLRKPVSTYFSPDFDKVALEAQIEDELSRIRADFKADGSHKSTSRSHLWTLC